MFRLLCLLRSLKKIGNIQNATRSNFIPSLKQDEMIFGRVAFRILPIFFQAMNMEKLLKHQAGIKPLTILVDSLSSSHHNWATSCQISEKLNLGVLVQLKLDAANLYEVPSCGPNLYRCVLRCWRSLLHAQFCQFYMLLEDVLLRSKLLRLAGVEFELSAFRAAILRVQVRLRLARESWSQQNILQLHKPLYQPPKA